jgi:ornithine decarboxylase
MSHVRPSVSFSRAQDAVRSLEPDIPLLCLRPHALEEAAQAFLQGFPGEVLYAVKCNPDPDVLQTLGNAGITHFDAASMAEIHTVRSLFPEAQIHFMHPVKARSAIRAAYYDYGVRDFVLDSMAELKKIVEVLGDARDLTLVVRLALPKGKAVVDLSGKFGANAADAALLLKACKKLAAKVGLSFHVGSQCVEPDAYERALALSGDVIAASGVALDILDVGGGFPVAYADVTPPPLSAFLAAIARGVAKLDLPADCVLWCEPGRALVAQGQSVVVQVQAKKGGSLYINDGVFGTLADAGPSYGLRFPCRAIAPEGQRRSGKMRAYSFYGPTCDSADRMAGPFLLPSDIQVGDWIEIGQVGAYGRVLSTSFNGFDQVMTAVVGDRPMIEQMPAVTQKQVRAA